MQKKNLWRRCLNLNIIKNSIIIETIKKEFLYGFRSIIYLVIIGLDILLTTLFSFELFYNKKPSPVMLPQVLIPYFYTAMLSVSFLIFMIAPSISISEEVENGTWDLIKANSRKYHRVILGKILWQIIFMIMLVLISIALMSLFYYFFVSFKLSMEIVMPDGHLKYLPNIKKYIVDTIFYSPLEVIIDIFTIIILCIPVILLGTFFSLISRKKLNSIIYSLSFAFFIIMVSEYIYGLNEKINNIYMKILYGLNPGYMTPLTAIPMKITSFMVPDKYYKDGTILTGNMYTVNYINVFMPFNSYLIIYISMLIILVLAIIILQWKK